MFTITITKMQIEKRQHPPHWNILKEEPCEAAGGTMQRQWGWTPKIMESCEVELEIYKQTVPEVNLNDVIAAVNGVMISAHDHELKKLADKAAETGDMKDLKAYLDARKKP